MRTGIPRAARGAVPEDLAVTLATTITLPASAAPTMDVVAEGFAGPLGLAVGDDGTVYVGEAFAGLLTTIDRHGTRSVLVDQSGNEIAGVDATGRGNVAFVQTLFDGQPPPDGPAPVLDATLETVRPNGRTTTVASLHDYEIDFNSDGGALYGFVDVDADCLAKVSPEIGDLSAYPGIVESHPYAVAIVAGGWLVADAAGNTIVEVGRNGRVSTLAVLPPVANVIDEIVADAFGLPDCLVGETYWGEPVPTDVEVGRDGDYYVSTLPGVPELPGSGAVWRIDSATGDLTRVTDGLTGAVDLAVADDGTIYVAELFADQISTVVGGVVAPWVSVPSPGAVEAAPDGTVYATTNVFGPGALVTLTP